MHIFLRYKEKTGFLTFVLFEREYYEIVIFPYFRLNITKLGRVWYPKKVDIQLI